MRKITAPRARLFRRLVVSLTLASSLIPAPLFALPPKPKFKTPPRTGELPKLKVDVPGRLIQSATGKSGTSNGTPSSSDTSGALGSQRSFGTNGGSASTASPTDSNSESGDKGLKVDDSAKQPDLPTGAVGPSTNGVESPGRQPTVFGLWWPVCVFMDPSVSQEKGNAAIKGMVDKAAACNVNIKVYPVAISTVPNDYQLINEKSREKCNIPDSLASAGSATVLVQYDDTPARMCDKWKDPPKNTIPDTAVAGCAELRSGSNATKGNDGHSHSVASGKIGVSIEQPSGHNDFVVSHEALGHSQMGKPNGSRYGMGIGEDEDFDKTKNPNGPDDQGENAIGSSGGWSGLGCQVMRSRALSNDRGFGYEPWRETYWVKPGPEVPVYDLIGSPPLFTGDKEPPPPGPGIPPPPAGDGGKPPALVVNDEAKRSTPPDAKDPAKAGKGGIVSAASPAGASGPAPKSEPAPEAKHKKVKIPESPSDRLVGNTAPEIGDENVPNTPRRTKAQPPPRRGGGAATGASEDSGLVTNDSAARATLPQGGGKKASSPPPASSSPGGGGGDSGLVVDDGAGQAALPGSGNQGIPSSSGSSGGGSGNNVSAGSSGLSIDDSAVRGSLPTSAKPAGGSAGTSGAGSAGGFSTNVGAGSGLSDSGSFFGEKNPDEEGDGKRNPERGRSRSIRTQRGAASEGSRRSRSNRTGDAYNRGSRGRP